MGGLGSPEAYRAVADRLDQEEGRYLAARILADGATPRAQDVAAALRDVARRSLSRADLRPYLRWVSARRADLALVTLNASAWLALEAGLWAEARGLAGEVVARDHHDLLAQRLLDAARAQSTSLTLEVDRWLATRTCSAPWTEMETRTNGHVHFCCSAWQPVPIGDLEEGTEGFWNSARAREIRRSVQEGDFSHCSRWHCPSIAERRLPPKSEPLRPRQARKGPDRVILSHDRSCNISCPSCRLDLINLGHKASDRLNTLYAERLAPLVAGASFVKVTGSGDPFASRHFRQVLKTLTDEGPPRRRIQLHTNALLANRRAWDDLGLWGNVRSVWVSVDAARPETYAIVRRGGDFAQLVPNLRFLGALSASGEIEELRLDFVVQEANYREMPAFVDLAREVQADGVYFLRLRNWGHFSAEAFRGMDVCDAAHPEHRALLDVLADPIFADTAVSLGSLSDLAAKAQGRAAAAATA